MADLYLGYDLAYWPDLSPVYGRSRRKRIDVQTTNLDSNLTDFPLLVMLDGDTDIGAMCLSNGYDVIFTASDGTTLLPFERVSFSVTGGAATAEFWVKTSLSTAGTYIYINYGYDAATDLSDAEDTWDSNFKAVYHMKDLTTSTIEDSTANGNDGTKTAANEPIEAAGKIGQGQDFDGTDDYIDLGSGESLGLSTNDFTLESWVYLHALPAGWATIFGGQNGAASFGVLGVLGALQLTKTNIIDGPGSSGVVSANSWNHIAVVFDSTAITDNVLFLINGAPEAAKTFNVDFTGLNKVLGEYSIFGGGFLDGLIDEARISSIARSAAWIKFEYYNMNEADGGLTWGSIENRASLQLTGIIRDIKLDGATATYRCELVP